MSHRGPAPSERAGEVLQQLLRAARAANPWNAAVLGEDVVHRLKGKAQASYESLAEAEQRWIQLELAQRSNARLPGPTPTPSARAKDVLTRLFDAWRRLGERKGLPGEEFDAAFRDYERADADYQALSEPERRWLDLEAGRRKAVARSAAGNRSPSK